MQIRRALDELYHNPASGKKVSPPPLPIQGYFSVYISCKFKIKTARNGQNKSKNPYIVPYVGFFFYLKFRMPYIGLPHPRYCVFQVWRMTCLHTEAANFIELSFGSCFAGMDAYCLPWRPLLQSGTGR
jgi:hypothetical protein